MDGEDFFKWFSSSHLITLEPLDHPSIDEEDLFRYIPARDILLRQWNPWTILLSMRKISSDIPGPDTITSIEPLSGPSFYRRGRVLQNFQLLTLITLEPLIHPYFDEEDFLKFVCSLEPLAIILL